MSVRAWIGIATAMAVATAAYVLHFSVGYGWVMSSDTYTYFNYLVVAGRVLWELVTARVPRRAPLLGLVAFALLLPRRWRPCSSSPSSRWRAPRCATAE